MACFPELLPCIYKHAHTCVAGTKALAPLCPYVYVKVGQMCRETQRVGRALLSKLLWRGAALDVSSTIN